MKVNDVDGQYVVASKIGQLVGEILGSQALGAQLVRSILSTGERPTEKNIKDRLRDVIACGSIQVNGVGPQKLQRLQSALQLGEALYADVPETGTVVLDQAVAAQAFHEIAWGRVERFAVLALDIKHRIISTKVISTGTATETTANPRDIFRWVMQAGGTRCIVGNNHPSGSLEPSTADITLTAQLIEGGKLLGILVLDHMIVSGKGFTSIRDTTRLWHPSMTIDR